VIGPDRGHRVTAQDLAPRSGDISYSSSMDGSSYRPVAGIVDFETYCGVTAAVTMQTAQGGQPPDPDGGPNAYEHVAASHGIDAALWRRAQLVWGARCALDPRLAVDMGRAAARAMGYDLPAMPTPPGLPPIDPSDPALAPIEGVAIETYCQFVARTMTGEDAADASRALGVPAEVSDRIMTAWGDRVLGGHPASTRYFQLVSALLA
jgi:hypothetical protein